MRKKEFKTESKKILDMMINSIYTNEEIFLRELISNGSDALDKLYYRSLTDKKLKVKKENLKIKVSFDKDNRTITIYDNGIGMTKEELENKKQKLSTISDIQVLRIRAKYMDRGYGMEKEEVEFCLKYLEDITKQLDTLEY